MFFDLDVPAPEPLSKKNPTFNPTQISSFELRLDLLVQFGYTVLALTQTVGSKIDPKSHVNILEALIPQLKRREGVVFLKRLTIELDGASEKGFGLTAANAALFESYDILALRPTTPTTLQHACLTHAAPSSLTTHIISIPSPLPGHLKHTLVRTATKHGAVFEKPYAPVLSNSQATSRDWWKDAREVARVTNGKNMLVSGGGAAVRAPRDVINLITLLGLAPDVALKTMSENARSVILRAQTRKTYRAVLSAPRLVMPGASPPQDTLAEIMAASTGKHPLSLSDDSDEDTNGQPKEEETKRRKKRRKKQKLFFQA